MLGNILISEGFNQQSAIFNGLQLSDSIYAGTQTRVILGQGGLPAGIDIRLTIIGENGNVIKDANNLPIENKKLNEFEEGIYYCDITIHQDTPEQYLRLYFKSNDVNILKQYSPQDVKLFGNDVLSVARPEIVPLSFFLDYIMNYNNNLDPLYRNAIKSYVDNNREVVRNYLLSAEGDLELKTKLYFTERTIVDEKRDYFFDRYNIHLWQFQVAYPPINELVEFKIQFSQQKLATIDKRLLVFDRVEGIIEFLPMPTGDSAGIYSLVFNNLSVTGTSLTFLSGLNLARIPALFRVTYKTGLIYEGCDIREKEAIRMAICNRALMKILPKIDPALRTSNYSEGIDGVSASRSYLVRDILRDYQEQENEFVHNLRMKYGRNIDMVIV